MICNAGIGEYSLIECGSVDMFKKHLDVNALGVVRVSRAFLPLCRKTKGSRIVIMSSLAGLYMN